MSYEIKPLGVGGILDQAVKLLKNHFGLFLGISMCVSVPFGLVMSFVMLGITPQLSENPTPQEIEALQQGLVSNFAIIMGMSFASMIIVYPLTTGAMIHAVASEYLGKPTTIGASIGRALQVFFPLLLTSFLMFLVVYVGFLFCIIPGFYFLVRYSLSSHAVVLDELSGPAALKRSSSLMLHDRTKNYNTLVLLWLLLGVIGFAINMVSGLIPQQHVAIVVGVLLQAVNGAFGAAAFAVFYFSCRCKAENFDLELLADAMHVETATPESPISPQ
jgi:hypothetical protein